MSLIEIVVALTSSKGQRVTDTLSPFETVCFPIRAAESKMKETACVAGLPAQQPQLVWISGISRNYDVKAPFKRPPPPPSMVVDRNQLLSSTCMSWRRMYRMPCAAVRSSNIEQSSVHFVTYFFAGSLCVRPGAAGTQDMCTPSCQRSCEARWNAAILFTFLSFGNVRKQGALAISCRRSVCGMQCQRLRRIPTQHKEPPNDSLSFASILIFAQSDCGGHWDACHSAHRCSTGTFIISFFDC